MKRLTRSNEKIVAGVIGGISNFINPGINTVFLRLFFALLTIFNPAIVLIYIGMAFIVPPEKPELRNNEVRP